jgi:hypothetical protein
MPYVHYKYEYPPLTGLLWYATTCLGFKVAGSYKPASYREFLDIAARVHYYAQSAVLGASYALLLAYAWRLGMSRRRILLLAALPSVLVYLIYNWDVLAALFATAGLYEYYKKRYARSGVFFGLSAASKLLTVGIPAWLVFELDVQGLRKERNALLAGTLAVAGGAFALVAAASWQGFVDFLQHHASWYCENCIYMIVERDIHSDVHRLSFVGFLVLTWLFMTRSRLLNPCQRLEGYLLLSLYSLVVLNYVFSPQMMLMLAPLSLLLLPGDLLKAYAAADALNAAIILLFFKDADIRRLLGLPVEFNPWTLSSPVQWTAMARNALLLGVMAATALNALARCENAQHSSTALQDLKVN